VPHVGWAKVELTRAGRAHDVLAQAFDGPASFFYHVHSFHPAGVRPALSLAEAEYGAAFPTVVGCDNVLGVQFHPEKSQAAGLSLLKAFAAWEP
jgi:glutamine amidotransferase